jgi:hypothetical protein
MLRRPLFVAALALGLAACSDPAPPPVQNTCPADTPPASPEPPAPRFDFAGIFDETTQSLIVFGGDAGQPLSCTPSGNAPLGDTWRFSVKCQRWIQLSPMTPPPARTGAATTYEGFPAPRNRMIMFGGRAADGSLLNDVWALDFTTFEWTQLATTMPAPEPRENATLAYNGVLDQVLLVGGNAGADPAQADLRNDVWMLDLTTNTWTLQSPPATGTMVPVPRMRHSATYDQAAQTLYVGFGENGSGNYLQDLWQYTYDTTMMKPTWTNVPVGSQPHPSARIGAGMDFDDGSSTGTRRILLFGGLGDDMAGGPQNDLWNFLPGPNKWIVEEHGDPVTDPTGMFCARPADFVAADATRPERRYGHYFAFGFPGFP